MGMSGLKNTCVSVFLCLGELKVKTMYHIYIATAVVLTVLSSSQVHTSTVSPERYPPWSRL